MLVSRPGNLQAHLLHCYLLEVSPKDSIMLLNTLINWKWHILFVFIHWYVIYGVCCVVSTELWGESHVFREREQRGWHPASIAASVMIKKLSCQRQRQYSHSTPVHSDTYLLSATWPEVNIHCNSNYSWIRLFQRKYVWPITLVLLIFMTSSRMLLDSDGGVEQTTFMYKLKRTFHQNWPYFLLFIFLNVTSYDVGIIFFYNCIWKFYNFLHLWNNFCHYQSHVGR